MTIVLDPDLGAALNREAQQRGVPPELLAVDVLRNRFLTTSDSVRPQDDWERNLMALAIDCKKSLADENLSREEIYD